jgi:hypothetical protein
MEDPEGALERRLRNAAASCKPRTPEDLLRFIDAVPAQLEIRRGWRLALHRGRVVARGLALAAAGIVVAGVAATAIVYVRSPHTADGSPTAGTDHTVWSWLEAGADTPLLANLDRVKNGWVAFCGAATTGQSCTSPDGVHWTSPMDPAIASVGEVPYENGPIEPQRVVSHDGVWLALLWQPNGFVRSTDGVHWSLIDDSLLQNQVSFFGIADTATGFASLEWRGGAGDSYVLTSPDGLSWTKSGPLPSGADASGLAEAGPAGIYVRDRDPGVAWRTLDGTSWSRVDMGGFTLPMGVTAIPGGYVAEDPYTLTTIESGDGLTWHRYEADLPGYFHGMVVVGDRMLVDVSSSRYRSQSAAQPAIWESVDWGKTWHPLLGPGGAQLMGTVQAYGNAAVIWEDYRLAWVGYLGPLHSAEMTAPASDPAPTPTQAPTLAAGRIMPESLRAEWTWRKTDGTDFQLAIAVPGGWVATCGSPADGELADAALCSSTDGLHWTKPADPAIVQAQGSHPFWPVHAVRSGGVYLAFSLSRPLPFVGDPTPVVWRSEDGHDWTEVSSPALEGLNLSGIGVLGGRFALIVSVGNEGSGAFLTSSDGVAWVKAGDTPVAPSSWHFADFGVFLTSADPEGVWVSADGSSWVPASLPAGVTDLGQIIRRADGSYIGIGYDFSTAVHDTLMTSTDGITWAPMSTPPGRPMNLQAVGGRLILNLSLGQANEAPYVVWQSSDGGVTWQSLPDPDGFPVAQLTGSFGDGLIIRYGDGSPIWIGTLNDR